MSPLVLVAIGLGLSTVLLWALAGFWAYGVAFAYFQRKWPELAEEYAEKNRQLARLLAVGGPIGLLVALFNSEGMRYGVLWHRQ